MSSLSLETDVASAALIFGHLLFLRLFSLDILFSLHLILLTQFSLGTVFPISSCFRLLFKDLFLLNLFRISVTVRVTVTGALSARIVPPTLCRKSYGPAMCSAIFVLFPLGVARGDVA